MSLSRETSALLLRDIPLVVRHRDRSKSYQCKVFFDLSRRNSLLIEPQESLHELCRDIATNESFYITVPNVAEPVECHVVSAKSRSDSNQSASFFQFEPRRSNVTLHSSNPILRVNAGVLNFAQYLFRGKPNQTFQLKYGGWILDFLPVTEETILYPPELHNDEYVFTHHVSIEKLNRERFTSHDAEEQLSLLADFLTLCRGYWVSTALTSGVSDSGIAVMEEWGTRKVSPVKRSSNWLDPHHGNSIIQLFPGFAARMTDAAWKAAIRHALYWNVRADTNLVGPDGGCLLLQAALERLAWHVLVRDRQCLSEDGFARMTAADQIRLLLTSLRIPLNIPTGLTNINAIAKGHNWQDGPQAFVEIRNRLIHPPKLNRKDVKLPYYEAYSLGKWYVELALLSACGYMGKYSNRTRKNRWVGEVEDVPWCNSEADKPD